MFKQIVTAVMLMSTVSMSYAAPTAAEGSTCAETFTEHSSEGLDRLNDYAQCWVNEFRADEESGSLLGHRWIRIDGEIYSIPEADLKKATTLEEAANIFKGHIEGQLSYPVEVALSSAIEAQEDYASLIENGASKELARSIVEVKFPGVVFIDRVVTETVTVEVPVEVEVIVEVDVPGETVYVDREVEVIVEVPGETVYVDVPGETVYVDVPGETVIKEVEVIKTVTTIEYVDREVTVEVPVEVIVEIADPDAYDDGYAQAVLDIIAEDGITQADVDAARSELQGQIDALAAERTVLNENAVANAEQIAALQTQINALTIERDTLTVEKAAAFAEGVASVPEVTITYGSMTIPVVTGDMKSKSLNDRIATTPPVDPAAIYDLVNVPVVNTVDSSQVLILDDGTGTNTSFLALEAEGLVGLVSPNGVSYVWHYQLTTANYNPAALIAQTAGLVANVVAQGAFEAGYVEGLVVGYGIGYDHGYDDGYQDGYKDGFVAGVASVTIK